MAENSSPDKDAAKILTSESIAHMTSAQIYEKNRDLHKGTFMDRTWRQASSESLDAITDPTLTRR